jgi:hypothetical protein
VKPRLTWPSLSGVHVARQGIWQLKGLGMNEIDYSSIIFTPEDIAAFVDEILAKKSPSEYHEYIQSWQWKEKADSYKKKAGNRCQLCHVSGYARPLHVHHNNYYRLGVERDTDLVVLCADCHKIFHDSGIGVQRIVKLTKEQFSLVLKAAGVTYTNDDPWHYYEIGKAIIDHLGNYEYDHKLYDYYNMVNRDICYTAIENIDRRNYAEAKESGDWQGYHYERDWREVNDYWTGWNGGKS